MVLAIALLIFLSLLNGCAAPLRQEPLQDATRPPVTDRHLDLARRYAPWIFKAVHPSKGRQDIPTPFDFDGDLDGENNWENMPRFVLRPTVYYTCLETESHWFVTYHLFHPRDWTHFDLGLHLTHEGDGENCQVVVDKESGRVVLLFTQAHYRGGVYADEGDGFSAAGRGIRGPLLRVNEESHLDPSGTHAAVFVESGGHGIYGASDHPDQVRLAAERPAAFDGAGMVLRPAREGEEVAEPEPGVTRDAPYQLESLTQRLWPSFRTGELVGEGRLLDGTVRYRDARVDLELPRYHEADRYSGPFGPDRGISPYAVDFDFSEGTLGALFFDPARRYREELNTPAEWAVEYIDYPFDAE